MRSETPPACVTRVARRDELSAAQREQMFALLTRYYRNATREQFEHDLAE